MTFCTKTWSLTFMVWMFFLFFYFKLKINPTITNEIHFHSFSTQSLLDALILNQLFCDGNDRILSHCMLRFNYVILNNYSSYWNHNATLTISSHHNSRPTQQQRYAPSACNRCQGNIAMVMCKATQSRSGSGFYRRLCVNGGVGKARGASHSSNRYFI